MLTSVWSRDQASFVNYLFSRMSYDAMRPRTLPSLAGNAGYWEHRTQSYAELPESSQQPQIPRRSTRRELKKSRSDDE